ncbi:MAG: hypothetical protein JXB88_25910 [Spirochaetales bacterium]|nr:hypothetical protein [Spirochaetales bacterium]
MKRTIILSIIVLFTTLVFSFAAEDEYDSDLFDIPDDVVTEAEESGSFTEETFSLYGYLVNFLAIDFIYDGDEFDTSYVGNISYLRLKGDWNPGENLSFHAEMSYDAKLGNQNPTMLFEHYGILSAGYQADFPRGDFIQTFNFDHFYGKMSIWRFDLQFGKMPIAWGTGYAFNPTQKVSLVPFMNTITEETPGTYGIAPAFSLFPGYAIEGYAAFQDKSHKTTSAIEDGDWNNLPYGIKLKGNIGSFDLSLSWIKEVLYAETAHTRSYYAGMDFAGGIWDVNVYGEAVVNLPRNSDDSAFDFEGHEAKDLLEACAGFFYTIPVIEADARCEYYHQGNGVTDMKEYNVLDYLSGEKILMGEDYLFLYLDKTFLDYYKVSAGAFFNLNDGSCALIPVISYDMYANFQVELGSTLFFGKKGSEFYGEYDLSFMGSTIIDMVQPLVYLKCKLSF